MTGTPPTLPGFQVKSTLFQLVIPLVGWENDINQFSGLTPWQPGRSS
jgi:hypothetical protein